MIGNSGWKPGSAEWTPEQVEQLRHYWEETGMSAGVIGGFMGRSRSAIIGKAHRMKFKERKKRNPTHSIPRKKRAKPPRGQTNFNFSLGRKAKTSARFVVPPTPLKLDQIVPLNGEGITILELDSGKCHAVVKAPDLMKSELARYCGHPAAEGESYCNDHYLVFHQPSKPRTRQYQAPLPRFSQ